MTDENKENNSATPNDARVKKAKKAQKAQKAQKIKGSVGIAVGIAQLFSMFGKGHSGGDNGDFEADDDSYEENDNSL